MPVSNVSNRVGQEFLVGVISVSHFCKSWHQVNNFGVLVLMSRRLKPGHRFPRERKNDRSILPSRGRWNRRTLIRLLPFNSSYGSYFKSHLTSVLMFSLFAATGSSRPSSATTLLKEKPYRQQLTCLRYGLIGRATAVTVATLTSCSS